MLVPEDRSLYRTPGAIVLVCIVCGCLVSFALAQTPTKPFSKDDVVQLLKGSVSSKRVGELAQQRGIDFQITPEAENELRQVGANDELLATLRSLAPKTATLMIRSSPGGAHVYVDDEPVGTTSAEGRLKLSTLTSGQHRVRLSLDGYRDGVKDVALAAGAALEFNLSLEPIPAVLPSSAATNAVEPPSPHLPTASLVRDPEAVIYIFRRSKFVASAVLPDVYCDGASRGQIHAGTYLTMRVPPGRHVTSSAGKYLKNEARIDLDAVAGGAYYIELSVLYGPNVTMVQVSKEIGESDVKGPKAR